MTFSEPMLGRVEFVFIDEKFLNMVEDKLFQNFYSQTCEANRPVIMTCLFPFLNTGVTLAEVHSAGSFPPLVEKLNSSDNGLERLEAPFRSRPGTPQVHMLWKHQSYLRACTLGPV